MMPILVKGDDVSSETKANACHGWLQLHRNQWVKNRYISWYLMLVAFSSPVKLSKIAFCMTFLRTFAVVLQTQFLLVVANHLKSDFSRYHY